MVEHHHAPTSHTKGTSSRVAPTPAFPGMPHFHFMIFCDPSAFLTGRACQTRRERVSDWYRPLHFPKYNRTGKGGRTQKPKGWSLRHAFRSSRSRALEMPDICLQGQQERDNVTAKSINERTKATLRQASKQAEKPTPKKLRRRSTFF